MSMSRKSLSLIFLVVLLALSLAACRRGAGDEDVSLLTPTAIVAPATVAPATVAPATATPQPGTAAATATVQGNVSATATAMPAAATSTAAPATVAPATAAPTATASGGPPPGGSTRINFAPGATSATVNSTLFAGGDGDTWLLRVAAGQVITVQTIASPPGQMVVSLMDMQGGTLAVNTDTAGISAAVPATGDYQINLATASGAPGVAYTMQVLIPPASGPVAPTRIQFAPGQAMAQLNDTLAAGGDLNSYVLTVGAGQTINVAVFASVPAVTNIYLRNAAGQMISSGTDMSGLATTVSAAGDYTIDVSNFNAAPAVSYTLTVTVPPLPVPVPDDPIRLNFGPGQSRVQLDGTLAAGADDVYVLAVVAGQSVLTDLTDNPPGNLDITVSDAAGNRLNFGRAPTSLGTVITTSGDVYVRVATPGVALSYSLTITVPPLPGPNATRISFAPGATSASVTGDLPFGGDTDSFVLTGMAGQTLHVTATVNEATGWTRLYVYDAASTIVGLGTDITGASAPLAQTGDYRIVIVSDPAAGPLSYTLTASIP